MRIATADVAALPALPLAPTAAAGGADFYNCIDLAPGGKVGLG